MRIAVLTGGTSPERDVSLSSGASVSSALRQIGHSVAIVDTAVGLDLRKVSPEAAFLDAPCAKDGLVGVDRRPPDLEELARMEGALRGRVFAPGVLETCSLADIVFIALHGGAGEDGRVQAALEMAGLPHTGADYSGCALAFNKSVAKPLMRAAGVPTPEWRAISREAAPTPAEGIPFGYPCIVKPAKGGSTIGVSLVKEEADLGPAVQETLQYGEEVLVEEFVEGREFTVGVLGDEALPVVEIETAGELFDYGSKYQPGAAREICPAPIPGELSEELRRLALLAHRGLRLGPRAYSRSDFRVTPDGRPYCLETNVLPGMTPNSLLPLAASTAGLDFPALCERIVQMAMGHRSPAAQAERRS